MADGSGDPPEHHRGRHHHDPVDEPGLPDEEGLPRDRPRGIGRRIIGGVVSYGVIVVIFWFLLSKLSEARQSGLELAPITPAEIAVATVLGVVNLLTNLPPICITLPGLRYREAFVTNTASAALSNTVPEGGAVATGLNFAMLRSWGFTLDRITSSYLTTGIWTNLCRYSLLAIALLALSATETVAAWVPAVAVATFALMATAVVVLILALRSERLAQWLGRVIAAALRPVLRLLRKPPLDDMEERVDDFRKLISATVGGRWPSLTLTMLLSQFTAFFILGVMLRMQGIDQATISWSRIVVAWGAMSLASLIVPTPGGLGVAEAALYAVLTPGLPSDDLAAVASAIVLFRGATWFLPIPIGSVTYLFWRKNRRWRTTAEERYGPGVASAADPDGAVSAPAGA